MNFTILVFSSEIKNGRENFDVKSIQKLFARQDCICKELLFFDDNLELALEVIKSRVGEQNTIVFMKNSQIDKFALDNINQLGHYQKTINEQALLFTKNQKCLLCLPTESDFITILQEVVKIDSNRKLCNIKLFGKNRKLLLQDMESLKKQIPSIQFTYFEENLITDLYISYECETSGIDENQVAIATKFQDCFFSENGSSLEQLVFGLLRLKNVRLSIYDYATGGRLVSNLFVENADFIQVLSQCKITNVDIAFTSENLYNHTVELVAKKDSEITICAMSKDTKEGYELLFAIADQKEVHIYKNFFKASKNDVVAMAVNSILYHLFKKLKQNDFAF